MKYIYKLNMVDDDLVISKYPIVAEDESRYTVKLNSGIRIFQYKRDLNKAIDYVTEGYAIYTDDLAKGKKEFIRAVKEEMDYYETNLGYCQNFLKKNK